MPQATPTPRTRRRLRLVESAEWDHVENDIQRPASNFKSYTNGIRVSAVTLRRKVTSKGLGTWNMPSSRVGPGRGHVSCVHMAKHRLTGPAPTVLR